MTSIYFRVSQLYTPHSPDHSCHPGISVHQCGETKELAGREPIFTLRCTSRGFQTGVRVKERFWLEERRKRVRRYDTTRLWESTRSLGKSEWDQKMRKMQCIIRCMIRRYEMMLDEMRCKLRSIYPKVSRIYTPRRSVHLCYPCISVHPPSPSPSPSSLYLPTLAVAQSSAKLSGGGGEKRIFLPQLESNMNTRRCTWRRIRRCT